MLESQSLFWSLLIFWSVLSGSAALFLISSALGIATKEILVFASVLWFANRINFKSPKLINSAFIRNTAIALCPILFFCSIRMLMGGKAFEVNYGYDLLRLEFPWYGKRLLSVDGLWDLLIKTFFAFCFLWLGVLNVRKNSFFIRSFIVIPLVILATFLLSTSIARIIGIIFPLIIPMFLYFFEQPQKSLKIINT